MFDIGLWFYIHFFWFISIFFCLTTICWLFIMAGEWNDSLQSISVRLDRKNYSYWHYAMKKFLKDKKMWVILLTLYANLGMKRIKKICKAIKLLGSKQFKNYHLDQQLSWEFDRYIVSKVWNYLRDLGIFRKIIYTV